MSRIIELPCADGTDPDCEGRLPAEYNPELEELTDEQFSEVEDQAEIFTGRFNDLVVELEGREEPIVLRPNTCDACGSDYTRDSEGRILN